jgi:peptidyl-prolyl cis-trans isomerase C
LSQTISKKSRVARYALVAAVAGALSIPMISQALRAQDAPAAAGQRQPAQPAGADRAQPAAQRAPGAADAGAKPVTATPPVDPNKVIVTAGDLKVTAGEFEQFLAGLPPQEQEGLLRGGPEAKRQAAEYLVKVKALKREADRKKLADDPKVKERMAEVDRQIEAQRERAKTGLLIESLVTGMQNDEAADKKYFEENPNQFGQVKARHILVSTQASADPNNPKPTLSDDQAKKKADDIRARLVKGEDFAAIAKAESDDPGSKETGGEYTFARGKMVPAFEKAAFGLEVKEISQPVKTPFGYHVIQLLERTPGSFEGSRQFVTQDRLEAYIKQLTGGDPKVDESFIAATPAAAAPAPAATGAAAQAKPAQPQPKPAVQPKPAANPK